MWCRGAFTGWFEFNALKAVEQENLRATYLPVDTSVGCQRCRLRRYLDISSPTTAKMSKISKLFKGSSSSSSSSSSKSKHHRSRGGPSPQEAIHKLRETEEMLTKKQDYLEKRIEQEIMVAKKNGTKNKRGMFLNLSEKHVHLLFRAKDSGLHTAIRCC